MNRTPLAIALFAAAALAGCDSQPETLEFNAPDPMANALANAAPVELPPAIVATHQYRCRDNSLLFVDWLADAKGANIRMERTSASTPLKPGADGQPPFTAEGGYSVTGSADAQSITVSLPGKDSLTCRRG
jgi:hypothetical protein